LVKFDIQHKSDYCFSLKDQSLCQYKLHAL
jgi:hypothetical protein